MTLLSFVIFIVVYLMMTETLVEPHYFRNFIFAIPFLCFMIITYFTVKGRMRKTASVVITVALALLLGFVMLCLLFSFVFEALTKTTTDAGQYRRVLKISGYPNNELMECFPDKIPAHAKNITFSYTNGILQGGTSIFLKYATDSDTIQDAMDTYLMKAVWIGKSTDKDVEKHGIFIGTLSESGYEILPNDFTIYVFVNKPYHPNDWNHGKLSLAAVSKIQSEILFYTEQW